MSNPFLLGNLVCSWRRTPTRPSRSSSISTRPTTPSTVTRKAAVRPDDGGVDHLHHVVRGLAVHESGQDHVPDARLGPASVLSKHRVPVAELVGQVPPRRTGPRNPKDCVQNPAVVSRRTPARA